MLAVETLTRSLSLRLLLKPSLFILVHKGRFCNFSLFMYEIQHCLICRPSDSTVSEATGIEPRQLRLRHWLSDVLTTRLDLIHIFEPRCAGTLTGVWRPAGGPAAAGRMAMSGPCPVTGMSLPTNLYQRSKRTPARYSGKNFCPQYFLTNGRFHFL